MFKKIIHNEELYALVIKREFEAPGVEFFTPLDLPIQMGYMNRAKGYVVKKHRHSSIDTKSIPGFNQEILLVRKGRLRTDIYSEQEEFIVSLELTDGDTIMFLKGGHGFEMLEPTDFVEIKQGPYGGMGEKVEF